MTLKLQYYNLSAVFLILLYNFVLYTCLYILFILFSILEMLGHEKWVTNLHVVTFRVHCCLFAFISANNVIRYDDRQAAVGEKS